MAIKLKVAKVGFPEGVPVLPGYVATSPRVTRKNSDIAKLKQCHGAAFGFDKTILQQAVGEAIERYAVSIYKLKDFTYQSLEELGDKAVNLKDFILFAEKQYQSKSFPFAPPKKKMKLYWVQTQDIQNKETKYLPASIVYAPPTNKKWCRLDAWTTNGLAAGKDLDATIVNGVCELIERDTLMCWWFSKQNAIQVSSGYFSQSDNITKLLSLLTSYNYNHSIFLIKNEMGIVSSVVAIRSRETGFYTFGSSCKLHIQQSVEHAITEAIMIARTQKILLNRGYKLGKVKKLRDHVLVPCSKRFLGSFDFIAQGSPVSSAVTTEFCDDHPHGKDALVNAIVGNGYHIYYTDVTPEILKDSGYVISRAVIPGLHPLETNHDNLHLDLRRLSVFLNGKNMKAPDLTPHPFG